jgi:hypothetical protein
LRSLSGTLEAEQKVATRTPYVKVEAKNLINGLVRLDWIRLYTGAEDDYFNALAIPGDGSLIRLRVTPLTDSRKLYYQRVTNPDEYSDFSNWSYLSKYNVFNVASCAEGAKVSQFFIEDTTFGVVVWVSPVNHDDPDGAWTNETNAYDENTSTYAWCCAHHVWGYYLKLGVSSSPSAGTIECTGIKIRFSNIPSEGMMFDVDVSPDNVEWHTVVDNECIDSDENNVWLEFPCDKQTVWCARVRVFGYGDSGHEYRLNEFYFETDKDGPSDIYHRESTDNGSNWGSWSKIGESPTSAVHGLAAAFKPNGDIALFFIDNINVYVLKRISGNWQSKSAWGKSTGVLSSVAAVYDDDWNLLVTGKDSEGNYKLWSIIYGDGGDVSAGVWSALKEFASASSGEGFEFLQAFMAKPAVYRVFYVEKFTGTESYNRPFWSHSIPGVSFLSNLWREPVPFNLSSEYGLAIAHHGDYCWLSSNNGVWRASLAIETVDLTSDVVSARVELTPQHGSLVLELNNSEGDYASLPAPLDIGCQIEFSPGYVTSAGNEVSSGLTFILEAYDYISAGGKSMLALQAYDGWQAISLWRARHQFRWNKSSNELSIKGILEFVLARVGLKLEVISASGVITSTYHDFTINPNSKGDTVIRKLLSFVPDVIFIEGNKVYLVNPLSSNSSVYSYSVPYTTEHLIYEGRYRYGAFEFNRVQVEGLDSLGSIILSDSFAWDEIGKLYDRFRHIYTTNVNTLAKAQVQGAAYLREVEIESANGFIRVPVNCGQQLYDVIDITDGRAGLSADKKRVMELILIYQPSRGLYEHRLSLGAV